MTLIRLEHENFDAVDTFAAILAERQTVSAASADGPADQRTTIYMQCRA